MTGQSGAFSLESVANDSVCPARRPTTDSFGIAKYNICENSRGSITVVGVFNIVKDPTTNIPAGTSRYWSKISFHVIKNAYAHLMIGIAVEDASAGFPLGCVRLFTSLMARMNGEEK